jgi:membrane protease YdiL (CAAX protease family)
MGSYFLWSRDPAIGLFSVLPLWLAYEALRLRLSPDERNGAEMFLLRELQRLDPRSHVVLSACFAVLIAIAARSLVQRDVPWARVVAVVALEGTMYALLLGPLASAMASASARLLSTSPFDATLFGNLVGSVGAGIFEELVFRLGLMSALVWIGARAVRAWSLPPWFAGVAGAVVSALVFSWFHHLCGEPYDSRRFVFRTMAGVLLGLLLWTRGFGVCVYTHTMYNVYFYLGHDG